METLQLVAAVCSILSLLVSLFVASKIVTIGNKIKVKGEGNITIGGDIRKG